jgi:dihydroxyacetone kinase-like predicted kinase
LNVFPVPDGDTGINMFLAMESAVDAMDKSGMLGDNLDGRGYFNKLPHIAIH